MQGHRGWESMDYLLNVVILPNFTDMTLGGMKKGDICCCPMVRQAALASTPEPGALHGVLLNPLANLQGRH